MYDSITAADIPAGAGMVGGYVDGIFRWSDADWARFPNAVRVRIAVSAATNDGHVLDQETGNATPEQAPGWVQMRRAAGADPSVYTNLGNWDTLRAAFLAQGVAEPHYWIAEWTGVPHSLPGAVACQYANPTFTGAHYDLSLVDDFWPGIDSTRGGTDMAIARHPSMQRADIFWPGPAGVQHRTYNGVSGAPAGAPDGWLLNPAQRSENLGGDPIGPVLGACWIDDRFLHVVIVDRSTGNLQVREFDLQGGWTPGWATVPDQAADLARIAPPGPRGDPGPPGSVDPAAVDAEVKAALQKAAGAL